MAISAEISLPWNGDFTISDTGDLLTAVDTPANAAGTIQRLVRLLLTSPVLTDGLGNFIAPPDDIFHPTWGAGMRAAVDGAFSEKNVAKLRSVIIGGLQTDPGVASSPQPQVSISITPDAATAYVNITITTVAGIVVPLPTITVTPQGT